jgi:site-specific recombinase XerD
MAQIGADLQTVTGSDLSSDLVPLLEQAARYVHASKATSTRRAYRADWAHFEQWCTAHAFTALPAAPETLSLYVTSLASEQYRCSTIQRRLAAISQAHQVAGQPTPTHDPKVRTIMQGIRRALGTAQTGKTPVMIEDLRSMLEALEPNLLEQRDRALLLVGFAGGFRRSELVSLDVHDIEFKREGLVVTLRRSKTDQEGAGRRIGIPFGRGDTCPVAALQDWLTASRITEGPVFRAVNRHEQVSTTRLTDQSVARVVKRSVKRIGLDPRVYAGHSLRSGLATSAAVAGVAEHKIQQQTGHRDLKMLRRYVREGDLFRGNAAGALGL